MLGLCREKMIWWQYVGVVQREDDHAAVVVLWLYWWQCAEGSVGSVMRKYHGINTDRKLGSGKVCTVLTFLWLGERVGLGTRS